MLGLIGGGKENICLVSHVVHMIPLDFILLMGLMMASGSNSAHLIYIYDWLIYHIMMHTFEGNNLGMVFFTWCI